MNNQPIKPADMPVYRAIAAYCRKKRLPCRTIKDGILIAGYGFVCFKTRRFLVEGELARDTSAKALAFGVFLLELASPLWSNAPYMGGASKADVKAVDRGVPLRTTLHGRGQRTTGSVGRAGPIPAPKSTPVGGCPADVRPVWATSCEQGPYVHNVKTKFHHKGNS